jgi:hypothetical protein
MPITINGSGTVTGISAGGLPDGVITNPDLAADAVSRSKLDADTATGVCKAFVNFNGTGTVAIRASYNVSSITDNGVSDYTVNFTTALADANYGFTFGKDTAPSDGPSSSFNSVITAVTILSSSLRVRNIYSNGVVGGDVTQVCVSIFR